MTRSNTRCRLSLKNKQPLERTYQSNPDALLRSFSLGIFSSACIFSFIANGIRPTDDQSSIFQHGRFGCLHQSHVICNYKCHDSFNIIIKIAINLPCPNLGFRLLCCLVSIVAKPSCYPMETQILLMQVWHQLYCQSRPTAQNPSSKILESETSSSE